jgi:hypothetical protein
LKPSKVAERKWYNNTDESKVKICNTVHVSYVYSLLIPIKGSRRERVVVGFTTTYAISVYHQ